MLSQRNQFYLIFVHSKFFFNSYCCLLEFESIHLYLYIYASWWRTKKNAFNSIKSWLWWWLWVFQLSLKRHSCQKSKGVGSLGKSKSGSIDYLGQTYTRRYIFRRKSVRLILKNGEYVQKCWEWKKTFDLFESTLKQQREADYSK